MADPRVVTQTLTIGFNVEVGSETLSLEVDGRSSGFNNGRTSFKPGDDVYILLYKSANVTIDTVISSKGTISKQAADSPQIIPIDDIIVFANDREASVSKPVFGAYTNKWLGSNLGSVNLGSDAISFTLAVEPVVKPYAGVGLLSYNTEADVYKLTNTLIADEEEYSIIVVAVGTAT